MSWLDLCRDFEDEAFGDGMEARADEKFAVESHDGLGGSVNGNGNKSGSEHRKETGNL